MALQVSWLHIAWHFIANAIEGWIWIGFEIVDEISDLFIEWDDCPAHIVGWTLAQWGGRISHKVNYW